MSVVDGRAAHPDARHAAAKRAMLRDRLDSGEPAVAVGAHDAVTSQLIERYGFDAVWASAVSLSVPGFAQGHPSDTMVGEAVTTAMRIDRATTLPVVADCCNLFDGRWDLAPIVQAYDGAGLAGICVDDNASPKRNQLHRGRLRRDLIPREVQARRIRNAKEVRNGGGFALVARTEALVAGWGVGEACKRADAYAEAGADAIAVVAHGPGPLMVETLAFLSRWRADVPVVVLPTLSSDLRLGDLQGAGFRLVVLAHHPIRAAVRAIEHTLDALRRERSPAAPNGAAHVGRATATRLGHAGRTVESEDEQG